MDPADPMADDIEMGNPKQPGKSQPSPELPRAMSVDIPDHDRCDGQDADAGMLESIHRRWMKGGLDFLG